MLYGVDEDDIELSLPDKLRSASGHAHIGQGLAIMDFIPKWIAWEITRRCNFSCVHCRSASAMEVQGHPDFDLHEARRLLEDIRRYADPYLTKR